MKKQIIITIASLAWVLLVSASVAAQEETGNTGAELNLTTSSEEPGDSQQPIYKKGGLVGLGLSVAGKVGSGFSQAFSDLGTSFVGELELGYLPPLPEPVRRDFQIFVSGAYAGPSSQSKEETDPRLPGDGTWSYDLVQRQLIVTLGLAYRVPLPLAWLRPYAAAGGRMYLTRTEISGEAAGEPFGDNEETATDFGFYGALGADFFIPGPGSILFEVQFGYAPVDSYVLRDTNNGALNLAVGYRLFI